MVLVAVPTDNTDDDIDAADAGGFPFNDRVCCSGLFIACACCTVLPNEDDTALLWLFPNDEVYPAGSGLLENIFALLLFPKGDSVNLGT